MFMSVILKRLVLGFLYTLKNYWEPQRAYVYMDYSYQYLIY